MRTHFDVSDEMRDQAYTLYSQHGLSVASIGNSLGLSKAAFLKHRKQWGWPERRLAIEQARSSQRALEQVSDRSTLYEAAMALARITKNRIDALAEAQSSNRLTEPDKTAKALADFAKTLTTAQALMKQETARREESQRDDNDDARSIHELRDELAHHLERIVAEEEALGRDGLLV